MEKQQKITWRSPSNIALVKYWGKHVIQLPCNPSISFTLENAFTQTSLSFKIKTTEDKNINLQFYFENKKNTLFESKIIRFLEQITPIFPFLPEYELEIHSHNSFPHSAGIASSASSMSALALCICSMEQIVFGRENEPKNADFWQKASNISRLGSGSACRSVYPKIAIWGKNETMSNASDMYAVALEQEKIHPVFEDFKDSILIIDKAEKQVSSRAGHALMNENPYAEVRYKQAHNHLETLSKAIQDGDLEVFIDIVEREALTLHALMMASKPPFVLMKPNTLTIIQKVQSFRRETKIPLCFTLDAGPNVHLLYPQNVFNEVQAFIKNDLLPLCEDGKIIEDQMGQGSIQLV
jgi:diphosphomevalonate decarboxylase